MGSVGTTKKPHAVLVPYPAQGHVNPLMKLGKLLHAKGFHITFVNTEFNHKRLIRSKGPESVKGFDDFRFETIPDGMPPSDLDATQEVPQLCYSTRKTCLVPFKELLVKLNESSEVPPVSCVISDGVMSFGIKAAEDLGIPEVQFWTASACSFIGYLHYRELIRREIFPFKSKCITTSLLWLIYCINFFQEEQSLFFKVPYSAVILQIRCLSMAHLEKATKHSII